MADTVELASRATRGCTDSPPEHTARQTVSLPPQRWRFVPASESLLGSSGNAASLDVAAFFFLFSHSLLEYAFEFLIFLRLDGIWLGYKGQPR
jgi:hypothetical protein